MPELAFYLRIENVIDFIHTHINDLNVERFIRDLEVLI